MNALSHPPLAARRAIAWPIILFAWIIFHLIGITWGLPGRWQDEYLFGSSQPWDGKSIASLVPDGLGGDRAADVAAHPLDRTQAIYLNATDADRARIILRYRLYSANPDEMITLRALAGMRPRAGDFDPRMYQYGGVWIYPVAALIGALLHPRPDLAWYLDHPEAFAHFYLVMRCYSAAWGLIAALVLYHLIRRASPSAPFAALVGAILFLAMPAIVTAAHDAKPHLAGLALTLIAIDLAANGIARSKSKYVILAGVAAGLATGAVLAAAPALLVPLIGAWRTEVSHRRRLRLPGEMHTSLSKSPLTPILSKGDPHAQRSRKPNPSTACVPCRPADLRRQKASGDRAWPR